MGRVVGVLAKQRTGKFRFKLGKTANETHEMIKSAYGDDAMGQSSVFEWHELFRE